MSETKPINEASQLLFRQTHERYQNEMNALAEQAQRVDSVAQADGWRVDIPNGVHTRAKPDISPPAE